MKILKDHVKETISICAIVSTIAVISMLGYTMSTDGSNQIYTRDELSERVTELENSTLKSNASFNASSRITSTPTANEYTAINNFVVNYSNDDYYEYSENVVTIKRSGKYRIYLLGIVNVISLNTSNTSAITFRAIIHNTDYMLNVESQHPHYGISSNINYYVDFAENETIRLFVNPYSTTFNSAILQIVIDKIS